MHNKMASLCLFEDIMTGETRRESMLQKTGPQISRMSQESEGRDLNGKSGVNKIKWHFE